MAWYVGVAIVALVAVFEGYNGSPLIYAVVEGVVMAWLVWMILLLGRWFRAKAPRAARVTGNILFGLAIVAAIYLAGGATYAAYQGAPSRFVLSLAGPALLYLAIGWALRRLLGPPAPTAPDELHHDAASVRK